MSYSAEPTASLPFVGFDFDILNEEQVVHRIERWIDRQGFFYIVTPNVDHAVFYDTLRGDDPGIAAAYRKADLTLCDSRILSLLAQLSGHRLPVVAGSDLTARLIGGSGPWKRLAVVGGDRALHERLEWRYPAFEWHFCQPPMGVKSDPDARRRIADFVERTGADLVFFAIGAPQSEICCREIAQRAKARGVALCVGASLEFLTGVKRRAPRWMQRAKLEWLYRLASEPKRLWRRYLIEGPKILRIWRRGEDRQKL